MTIQDNANLMPEQPATRARDIVERLRAEVCRSSRRRPPDRLR